MNSAIADAATNGGNAAEAFHKVGLNLAALSSADTSDRLNIIAEAVKNAGSQTEKLNIATAAFGAQGAKMVHWLSQGKDGLDAAAAGFKAVHGAVDDLSFAKLQVGRNALGDVNDVLDTMKMLFAEALTPAILAASKAIESFVANKGGFAELRDTVADAGSVMAKLGGDFTQGVAIIYNEMGELVAQIGVGVYQIAKVFVQVGSAIWDAFSRPLELAEKLWDEFVSKVNGYAARVIGTMADMAAASGMDEMTVKLTEVAAHLQLMSAAASESSSKIKGLDTSTPQMDDLIAGGQEVATMFRNRAQALEDSIGLEGTWGDAAVAAISRVTEAINTEAQARVDRDVQERASAAESVKTTNAVYEADLAAAKMFYDTLVPMATSAYQIMFDSENAINAQRELTRQANLEAYTLDLQTQMEASQARYDVEQEMASGSAEGQMLRERNLNQMILDEKTNRLEQERKLEDQNVTIWEAGYKGKLDVMQGFFGQMSVLMQSSNRKMFEIGKASAIAETVINTYKAATAAYSSLAGIPIVGPALGAAAAGAAVVAGLANVKKIQSTQFGSGGAVGGMGAGGPGTTAGGGNGVGGAPDPGQGPGAAAPQISRQVNVTLQGDVFSAAQVRALISQINAATDDNTTLKTQVG
jgi:hypothetical protein